MNISEAKALISAFDFHKNLPQRWADLGCGTGIFTFSLQQLLPVNSTIYAIDKQQQVFNQPGIDFIQLDFEKNALPVSKLSGLLMANALHFIKDPLTLLISLKGHLDTGGALILVEYDTNKASQWVPYPLPVEKTKELGREAGFQQIQLLGKQQSIYHSGGIYAIAIS